LALPSAGLCALGARFPPPRSTQAPSDRGPIAKACASDGWDLNWGLAAGPAWLVSWRTRLGCAQVPGGRIVPLPHRGTIFPVLVSKYSHPKLAFNEWRAPGIALVECGIRS
jgi:hypothetical protein